MARHTRRWMLSSLAGAAASLAVTGKLAANTGVELPQWGQTAGTTSLQAGPLGLNPGPDPGQVPVASSEAQKTNQGPPSPPPSAPRRG